VNTGATPASEPGDPRPAAVRVLGEGHLAYRTESREKSDNEKKRETFHLIALLHVTWWNLYR
jgi:hypothetical protein